MEWYCTKCATRSPCTEDDGTTETQKAACATCRKPMFLVKELPSSDRVRTPKYLTPSWLWAIVGPAVGGLPMGILASVLQERLRRERQLREQEARVLSVLVKKVEEQQGINQCFKAEVLELLTQLRQAAESSITHDETALTLEVTRD